MAQFTIYKSTDASAPTLSGTAGDLVALLDACLRVGYGSKTAAGWTKPYTGTNKAAFRQGAGNQFYLRVQDDAPGAGTAKEARVLGYETMSDVDTGTNLFPTAAQLANGMFARKSFTADATTRAWVVAADDRTCYVFISTGDTAGMYYGFMFGDIYSLVASDGYRTMLIARTTENSALASAENMDRLWAYSGVTTAAGHYIARGHNGTGGAVSIVKTGDYSKAGQNATTMFLFGNIPYANPADGGLYASPVWVQDPATSPAHGCRGRLRGFYHQCHAIASFADLDTVSGAGDLAGKTFLLLKQSANAGVYMIETSATLETN